MKKSTANKLNMYGSVLSVLNDHQTSWQPIPAFVSAVSSFNTKMELLHVQLAEQLGATTGVTLDKKLRMTDLRERILVVQHALFLLGRATGDVLLRERNSQTKTELFRLTLNELASRCVGLKQDIDTYGPQLSVYGVTTQAINELIPLLETVNEVSNSTRKAIIRRKDATRAISELEHEIDELLQVELDRLMILFKLSDPQFYNSFQSARITINYGSGGPTGTRRETGDGNLAS